jgi:hypothetical protein
MFERAGYVAPLGATVIGFINLGVKFTLAEPPPHRYGHHERQPAQIADREA